MPRSLLKPGFIAVDDKTLAGNFGVIGHGQRGWRVRRQRRHPPTTGVGPILDVGLAGIRNRTRVVGPRQARHTVATKLIAQFQPFLGERCAEPSVLLPRCLSESNGMKNNGDDQDPEENGKGHGRMTLHEHPSCPWPFTLALSPVR